MLTSLSEMLHTSSILFQISKGYLYGMSLATAVYVEPDIFFLMSVLFYIYAFLFLYKPLSLVRYTLISSAPMNTFFRKKQSNHVSICAEKQTIILSALRLVILMKKHDLVLILLLLIANHNWELSESLRQN